MSCYFRHLKEDFEQAGIIVTQENKKEIDRLVHDMVAVTYKNCSPTWKAVKERIRSEPQEREAFFSALKKKIEKC
jgi:hypothetical protein